MTNVIEHVARSISETIEKAIKKAQSKGDFPQENDIKIHIETPKDKGHGDFATNIAMQMTKQFKMPPREIAKIIIDNIDTTGSYIQKTECAGPGFINFYLNEKWLSYILETIQKEKEGYGTINIGKGEKVMVEFVSANPTGPLHMGNARGGALGDCIARVLKASGYDVTKEFYVNDAGNQIEKFAQSLSARYIQQIKGEDAVDFPEDGYQGEDIIEHVKEYIEANGNNLIEKDARERMDILSKHALSKNLEKIKNDLLQYGISFDVWFSEQSLYDNKELEETIEYLKLSGYTYEKDGALWFKASDFGTEKDEVLVRKNGIPTYFASDIAYHKNKFAKRGFCRVINLLGADHHGHAARMKAAVSALGISDERLDIVIFQLVRLYRNGEVARMSKRTGRAITLVDLLDEVGRDAARFFFNTKASGNHLDFDLDLAVKQSNENPVYYVQYAHARICSMLKLLENEGVKVPSFENVDLSLLICKEEVELIKKLAEFPEEINISANTLEPSRLTRYILDVASLFHSFYNACRVKGEEKGIAKARLLLVDSTRIVIRNVLDILNIGAPEKM